MPMFGTRIVISKLHTIMITQSPNAQSLRLRGTGHSRRRLDGLPAEIDSDTLPAAPDDRGSLMGGSRRHGEEGTAPSTDGIVVVAADLDVTGGKSDRNHDNRGMYHG